ncbi:helix-turn-helix transcriptional regulator [bacterium]|nr:helix-turn-helix transcriptional regulator [bacterium]
MLSPLTSMARAIRRARFKRKLTQSAVAKRSVGCGQSYVAQVEGGRCPCSRPIAEKLEMLLKVKRGTLTRFDFPRGRPRLNDKTRMALNCIREAVADHPECDLPSSGHRPVPGPVWSSRCTIPFGPWQSTWASGRPMRCSS